MKMREILLVDKKEYILYIMSMINFVQEEVSI